MIQPLCIVLGCTADAQSASVGCQTIESTKSETASTQYCLSVCMDSPSDSTAFLRPLSHFRSANAIL